MKSDLCKSSDTFFKYGLAVAALVTFLLALWPHIAVMQLQAKEGTPLIYTPVHLNHNWTRYDDVSKLLGAMNFARHGRLTGHVSTPDFPDAWYVNAIPEALLTVVFGTVIKLTGNLNIPFYMAPFFVALAMVFASRLIYRETKDPLLAICAGLIMVFGHHYFYLENFKDIFFDTIDFITSQDLKVDRLDYEYNSFYRIYQLGSSYFVVLWFLLKLTEINDSEKVDKKTVLSACILFAMLFYLYIFYAMAMSLIVGILFLAALWRYYRTGEKTRLKNLFFILLTGGLAGIPVLVTTLQLMHAAHADWFLRVGSSPALFHLNMEMVLFGLAILLVAPRGGFKPVALALVVTVLFIENASLLFGINFQVGHVYVRFALPVLTLLMVCLTRWPLRFGYLNYGYRFLVQPTILLLTIYILYQAVHFSEAYAKNSYRIQGITYEQDNLIKWLNGNAQAGSVVGSLSPDLEVPMNFFAPVYPYTVFGAQIYSSVPNSDIHERMALLFFLGGGGKENVERFFDLADTPLEKRYLFYYYTFAFDSSYDSHTKKDAVREIGEKLELVRDDPLRYLKKRRIDYFVTETSGNISTILSSPNLEYLRLVSEFGKYRLYEVLSGLGS